MRTSEGNRPVRCTNQLTGRISYNTIYRCIVVSVKKIAAPLLERHPKQTLACLSKLQLLCVHPSLVVDTEDGEKRREMSKVVELSGKLMALRELLWDAGIGER